MQKSKDTMLLLLLISKKISSREDCKHENYTVTIKNGSPFMYPKVMIYPNRCSRKRSDKVELVSYLMSLLSVEGMELDLVDGTYIYDHSLYTVKRHWRRS